MLKFGTKMLYLGILVKITLEFVGTKSYVPKKNKS